MWISHPDCGSVLSLKWEKPLAKFFCGAGSWSTSTRVRVWVPACTSASPSNDQPCT